MVKNLMILYRQLGFDILLANTMHDDFCEHITQNYHIFKHEVWYFDPTEFLVLNKW